MSKVSLVVGALLVGMPLFAGQSCPDATIEEAAKSAAQYITQSSLQEGSMVGGKSTKIVGLTRVTVGTIGTTGRDCDLREASGALGLASPAVEMFFGCGVIMHFNSKDAFLSAARLQNALITGTVGELKDGTRVPVRYCLTLK